jgi:phosphoribosylformylglycinamidine cyclo-ligase
MLWRNYIYYKEMPELLEPTTIYSPLVQDLLDVVPILGMSHITGGGIPENLPRCLPKGLTVDVDYNSWERPELFNKIQEAGDITEEEMRNVFNLGIGFCVVVPPDDSVQLTQEIISDVPHGMRSWVIGEVA